MCQPKIHILAPTSLDTAKTMSTFPSDVLAEILCRLPVERVLRFRCVSKSWQDLIDSTEFAKLHLNRSLKSNSNFRVILRELDYYQYGKGCFYSLSLDSLYSRVATPKDLKNPIKSCEFKTKILGSCNGLLLLYNSVDELAIWNPSTGKYKKLPVLGFSENNGQVRFGFGYDAMDDDYKVVRIAQSSDSGKGSFRSDVKIYSLKSNSWKVVSEFPYYLRYHDQLAGVYLNGALHWIASNEMEIPSNRLIPLIVAFDLGTENCRVIPHPPYTDNGFVVKLVVLGSSLCTYHTYFKDSYDSWGNVNLVLDHVDIWEMKKYAVKDSWTMIMSLQEPDEYLGNTVVPLAYSKSREEVLVEQDNRRFLWSSIKDDFVKVVDVERGGLRGFLHFNSCVYVASLVQINFSDDKGDPKKEYNQDKGGKKKALKKRGDDFLSKGFKLKL